MIRVILIIALVGMLMVTGVAGASPVDQVRLPVSVTVPAESQPQSGSVVVVEKGDHLWKIAARHVGSDAGDDEIAPYWRRVIDVNTSKLRSGDPDLIYPGEIVALP